MRNRQFRIHPTNYFSQGEFSFVEIDHTLVDQSVPLHDGFHHPDPVHWQLIRSKVFARDGRRCVLCNKHWKNARDEGMTLELHHRTYERFGCELAEDVYLLCSRCHAKTHGKNFRTDIEKHSLMMQLLSGLLKSAASNGNTPELISHAKQLARQSAYS